MVHSAHKGACGIMWVFPMRAPTVGTTKPGGAESFIILEERTADLGASGHAASAAVHFHF